ncbi:hypothetical protein P775_21280 [Puniceibacterium antarcticum]|uniref:Uncharacterized protein n=1 Tax=Puniceibacterium antarcticum TaxID=1206336 RepID=A0A2G8R9B0_9RHOB|nr:hypothetical protein [Puniceibacterium antarcticum]PIL18146.1 hypothetical protein P775_21280 [Puniceibacterium antarcticum]
MSPPVTSQIVWRNISIEITFHERRWKSDFDHIELRVEEGWIIPVTQTGYRSHFLLAGTVDEHGGHVDFVLAWLDHEADKPEWKRREDASRQMSLF